MNKGTSLVKNTMIYAIGNLGSKLLTFLMLPVYTMFLTTIEYGKFDIIVTTVALVLPIVSFQVTDGIYRFILTEENEETRKKTISSGAYVVIKNLIIFTIGYFAVGVFINIEYKYFIYFYIVTMLIYTFLAQTIRGLKKNVDFAVAGIVVTVVTVILNLIFIVLLEMKVEGLILAYIIAYTIAIIYIQYKTKIISVISFKNVEKEEERKLKKYSLPLIPNVISWWVMNASDRYMIKIFIGDGFNGLYAASNKFSSVIVIINSFFSLAWQESAITEYNAKDRDEYYTQMFNAYMKFQMTTAIVLIAGTKVFFDILIQVEFREGYVIVPIMYIASVFSAFSVFYGTGYQSANDTKGSFYTTVYGAVINIILNVILIPNIGMIGAAISTMISYIIVWIIRVRQTKKYFDIKIEMKSLVSLLVLMCCFMGAYYIDNKLLELTMILLSGVIFIIYNNELIKKAMMMVIGKIKKK